MYSRSTAVLDILYYGSRGVIDKEDCTLHCSSVWIPLWFDRTSLESSRRRTRPAAGAICSSQLYGWSCGREVCPCVSQILIQTHSELWFCMQSTLDPNDISQDSSHGWESILSPFWVHSDPAEASAGAREILNSERKKSSGRPII